jgi:hypothetical protein
LTELAMPVKRALPVLGLQRAVVGAAAGIGLAPTGVAGRAIVRRREIRAVNGRTMFGRR